MGPIETLRTALFMGDVEVPTIGRWVPDYPWTHLTHNLIRQVCERVKPGFWIEIGSMFGGSAIRVAEVTKEMGLETDIVCIDPFSAGSEVWLGRDGTSNEWLGLRGGRPTVYEAFLLKVHHAGHSDRIMALPMTSACGLRIIERFVACC